MGTILYQYKNEKGTTSLTGFAGLPLYLELAIKSGFARHIQKTLCTKQRGWSDLEMVMSLILLNLAGGDCVNDIDRLEEDKGLKTLLLQFSTHGMKRQERRVYEARWRKTRERGLPSRAAIHRFLKRFHHEAEEGKREEGRAFIPAENAALTSLLSLNSALISAIASHTPSAEATLDQDATLASTQKRTALYCYKKHKAY